MEIRLEAEIVQEHLDFLCKLPLVRGRQQPGQKVGNAPACHQRRLSWLSDPSHPQHHPQITRCLDPVRPPLSSLAEPSSSLPPYPTPVVRPSLGPPLAETRAIDTAGHVACLAICTSLTCLKPFKAPAFACLDQLLATQHSFIRHE